MSFLLFSALFFIPALAEIVLERLPSTNLPPLSRIYHFMDYNEITNQLVIFGGSTTASIVFNDVWIFDINKGQYFNLEPTNDIEPETRIGVGGFVDSTTNSLYVYGGRTSKGTSNEFWRFDIDELKWEPLVFNENFPVQADSYGFTKFDQGDDLKFLFYGGYNNYGLMSETWVYFLNNNTWQNWTDTEIDYGQKPYGDRLSLAVYGDYLYLAGGLIYDEVNDFTYRQNLKTYKWEILDIPSGKRYTPGLYYQGDYLLDGVFHLVLGIDVYSEFSYSIYALNLSNPIEWKEEEGTTDFLRESFAYSLISEKSFYMFGGFVDYYHTTGYYGACNELIVYDVVNHNWKSINSQIETPPARSGHSILNINQNLYVFGGTGLHSILDDLWTYSIVLDSWSLFKSTGSSPGKRTEYAAATQGDSIFLWGGYYKGNYLNDLYVLNTNSKIWTKFKPSGAYPDSKIGSCLIVNLPKLYIFGGETMSVLTNELWEYDIISNTYTFLNVKLQIMPSPVKYPVCEKIGERIFISLGEMKRGEPACTIFSFDVSTHTWKLEYEFKSKAECRSRAGTKIVKSRYAVIVGGQNRINSKAYKTVQVVDLELKSVEVYPTNEYFYGGSFAVFGSKMYLHGGGTMLGSVMRSKIHSYNFYSIDFSQFNLSELTSCFAGSYLSEGFCKTCRAGSFSSEENSETCEKCAPGEFNNVDGANSKIQCYPCSSQTYTSKEGSTYCLNCLQGYSCPIGSNSYTMMSPKTQIILNQPSRYKPDLDTLNKSNYILYALACGVIFIASVVILLNRKIRIYLQKIDVYFKYHGSKDESLNMIMSKNTFGGYFTVVFIVVAIFIIIFTLLEHEYNNTKENKTLIPIIILNEIEDVCKGNITVLLAFYQYGGECIGDKNEFEYSVVNLEYDSYSTMINKVNRKCLVSISFINCIVKINAYLSVKLKNYNSFCSNIELNLTSTSSIEHELSSYYELISSDKDKIFRGGLPTVFNLLMIPSLYKYSRKQQTGYHVSAYANTVPGTTLVPKDMAISSGFSVKINLVLSTNGLFTKRYDKQSIFGMLSALFGSVFGAMSTVGGVMAFIESKNERITKFVKSKQKLSKIIKKKKRLEYEISSDDYNFKHCPSSQFDYSTPNFLSSRSEELEIIN